MIHSKIVPVRLYKNTDKAKKVLVSALLDDQSDACFVKNNTLETLQVTGLQVNKYCIGQN